MATTCPECGRPIEDDDAVLCLYCGASLRRTAGFISGLKYKPAYAVLAAAIALLIFAFLLVAL